MHKTSALSISIDSYAQLYGPEENNLEIVIFRLDSSKHRVKIKQKGTNEPITRYYNVRRVYMDTNNQMVSVLWSASGL